MFEKLNNIIENRLASRGGFFSITALSFLESTVIAVPIEPLLLPTMTTGFRRALWIALALLLGCVLGSMAFYGLAALLFDPVVQPLLQEFGWKDEFEQLQQELEQSGFWTLFMVGVTPVPLQAGTLSAGFIQYSLPLFILAMAASRGIRYFGLALLAYGMGRAAPGFVEKYKAHIVLFGTTACLLAYGLYLLIQ